MSADLFDRSSILLQCLHGHLEFPKLEKVVIGEVVGPDDARNHEGRSNEQSKQRSQYVFHVFSLIRMGIPELEEILMMDFSMKNQNLFATAFLLYSGRNAVYFQHSLNIAQE